MNELWEALLREKLAKKKGQLCSIDGEQMQEEFIISNGLAHCLCLSDSRKQPVLRVGFAETDESAGKQWKSKQEPPRPLRIVGKQFREGSEQHNNNNNNNNNNNKRRTVACSQGVVASSSQGVVASSNQGVFIAICPHKQRILVSSCRLFAAAATPESKGFSFKNCRISRHA
jgi:hypothetical protein